MTYRSIGLAAIALAMLAQSLVRVREPAIGAGASGSRPAGRDRPLGAKRAVDPLPVSIRFGVPLAIGLPDCAFAAARLAPIARARGSS